MSDTEAAEALRSNAPLVVIEAAAGCGKTFQGAKYAEDLLPRLSSGRMLVLTHTNAACDVFASKTSGFGRKVEIRTIDSFVTKIAAAYHSALDLPSDVPGWAYSQGSDGFDQVARRVASLLVKAPSVTAALAVRYPYVVCDEHQDSSEAQEAIVLSLLEAGSKVRIFGDSMQIIYAGRNLDAWLRRWNKLLGLANCQSILETPHRWRCGNSELGAWINDARTTLKRGQEIDLSCDLPGCVTLIRAENTAARHGQYIVSRSERRPIDGFVTAEPEILVLVATNKTVGGLRAFFNRRLPIWEGHTRNLLAKLVDGCDKNARDPIGIAELVIDFIQGATIGFGDAAYASILRREVVEQCHKQRRGRPAKIQEVARCILESPDHRGAGRALATLFNIINDDSSFSDIKVDLRSEFIESTHLSKYEDPAEAIRELTSRRRFFRRDLPPKVISNIHKAKGFERDSVLIVPCDQQHFGDSDSKRRLFYVAMSRAKRSLALVVPLDSPSPLFLV